jgi:hypothetical protein
MTGVCRAPFNGQVPYCLLKCACNYCWQMKSYAVISLGNFLDRMRSAKHYLRNTVDNSLIS